MLGTSPERGGEASAPQKTPVGNAVFKGRRPRRPVNDIPVGRDDPARRTKPSPWDRLPRVGGDGAQRRMRVNPTLMARQSAAIMLYASGGHISCCTARNMEKKRTKGKNLPCGFSLWKPFPQTAKGICESRWNPSGRIAGNAAICVLLRHRFTFVPILGKAEKGAMESIAP